MATFKDSWLGRARDMASSLAQRKVSESTEQARRWIAARRRLLGHVGVWYHADYSAPGLAARAHVPHIDLERGKKVVNALEQQGLLRSRDVRAGAPVPFSKLLLAHSMSYLESVTEAATLGRIFGLEESDVDVDTMLRSQRRAVGGTLEASVWAAAKARRLAFNLGGGFHHAEPEGGGGFCIYNDVATSIMNLRQVGFDDPIAIIDLDFHQGNGNSAAFADDASVLTYSLQGAIDSPSQAMEDIVVELPSGTQGGDYLSTLRRTLVPAIRSHAPTLVFYVAGTDVLAGDALGDFQLSERGVFLRDQLVLELSEELGASTVVTMAGGYSQNAWRCTARMLRWALSDSIEDLPSKADRGMRTRYGQIAQQLDPYELMSEGNDLALTEEELMGELEGSPTATRILGYYSMQAIELVFERYGFLKALRERGFSDIRFDGDPSDASRQRLQVHGSRDRENYHLLVELMVGRRHVELPDLAGSGASPEKLEMLSIEWLLLQDPDAEFSQSKSRLPGQVHPGLGLFRELMEMLYQSCLRLDLDGLVMHPSRFHIAALGASQCKFLNPKIEGQFQALRSSLGAESIARVSRLMELGNIQRGDGQVIEWQPEDFMAPVSKRLQHYFDSSDYSTATAAARDETLAAGIRVVSNSN